jgi:excisionase family DNA binding protein
MANRRDIPELLTVNEAASIARCTPDTLRIWIAKGILPASRPVPNGSWKIKSEDLAKTILHSR